MFDLVRPRRVLRTRQIGSNAAVLTLERRAERLRAGCHIDVGLLGMEKTPVFPVFGRA